MLRFLRNTVARYSRGTGALAVAGGYAVIVTWIAAFVLVASSLKPGSIAGMWLFLATVPSSLVLQLIPAEGVAFALLLTFGGVVQAWLLWVLVRGKRVPQRR